jgi:hypothetical protein
MGFLLSIPGPGGSVRVRQQLQEPGDQVGQLLLFPVVGGGKQVHGPGFIPRVTAGGQQRAVFPRGIQLVYCLAGPNHRLTSLNGVDEHHPVSPFWWFPVFKINLK